MRVIADCTKAIKGLGQTSNQTEMRQRLKQLVELTKQAVQHAPDVLQALDMQDTQLVSRMPTRFEETAHHLTRSMTQETTHENNK